MPLLDVFASDNFGLVSLTAAINKLPYKPSRLAELNLFKTKGISTTTALIEEKQGVLSLVATAARGTMPRVGATPKRKVRPFSIPHLPLNDAVMADEVQNVRAFGSETDEEMVNDIVNDKLSTLRQAHEVTHEYHRLGAIKGVTLDADGSTELYDWFDEFDLSQDEVDFDFASDKIKQKCVDIIRMVNAALGATTYDHVHAICGDNFFDKLVMNEEVEKAYHLYTGENKFLMTQQAFTKGGFMFGDIIWENYRGQVGDVKFVDDDECHFFPVGAPDLFLAHYAPANFMETVNTIGKPIYAKQELMDFDVGVELHTQSNPLFLCTRPKCLIKGNNTTPES